MALSPNADRITSYRPLDRSSHDSVSRSKAPKGCTRARSAIFGTYVQSSKEIIRWPCNLRMGPVFRVQSSNRPVELTGNSQIHCAFLSKPTLLATAPTRDLARLTWFLEKPASAAASKISTVDR